MTHGRMEQRGRGVFSVRLAEHRRCDAFGARVGVESEPRGFWRASGRDYQGRGMFGVWTG